MITVENKRTYKGQGVYIGRGQGGVLGNPVVKGRRCPVCGGTHNDNGSTLPCYKRYLWGELKK